MLNLASFLLERGDFSWNEMVI